MIPYIRAGPEAHEASAVAMVTGVRVSTRRRVEVASAALKKRQRTDEESQKWSSPVEF